MSNDNRPLTRRRVNLTLTADEYEAIRRAAGSMPATAWARWAALRMAGEVNEGTERAVKARECGR